MTEQQAMRMALEAMEYADACLKKQLTTKTKHEYAQDLLLEAGSALRQALEQHQDEPVALQMDVIVVNLVREGINKHRARELAEHFIKYTNPQPAAWVGLTDVEIKRIGNLDWDSDYVGLWYDFAKAIEAKLKEKNT